MKVEVKNITVAGMDGLILIFEDRRHFVHSTVRISEVDYFAEPIPLNEYMSDAETAIHGSCILSENVETFKRKFDGVMTDDEEAILGMAEGKKFVISVMKGARGVVEHEISHILFNYDSDYRAEVEHLWHNILGDMDRRVIRNHLLACEYEEDEIVDEFFAFFFSGYPTGMIDGFAEVLPLFERTTMRIQKLLG